jgi:hypothetical protein
VRGSAVSLELQVQILFEGLRKAIEPHISFVSLSQLSQVQFSQSQSIPQDDLTLRWAQETKDPFAMEI